MVVHPVIRGKGSAIRKITPNLSRFILVISFNRLFRKSDENVSLESTSACGPPPASSLGMHCTMHVHIQSSIVVLCDAAYDAISVASCASSGSSLSNAVTSRTGMCRS